MFFGKIVIKNNYEEEGDLVFRPLFRAYKMIGIDSLLKDNEAYILGIIDNNKFHELFTKKEIYYSKIELVDIKEFNNLVENIPIEKALMLKDVLNVLLEENENKRGNPLSSMEDLAQDRVVEFNGYNKEFTDINPYEEPFNAYNNFNYKCRVLKKRKTM